MERRKNIRLSPSTKCNPVGAESTSRSLLKSTSRKVIPARRPNQSLNDRKQADVANPATFVSAHAIPNTRASMVPWCSKRPINWGQSHKTAREPKEGRESRQMTYASFQVPQLRLPPIKSTSQQCSSPQTTWRHCKRKPEHNIGNERWGGSPNQALKENSWTERCAGSHRRRTLMGRPR